MAEFAEYALQETMEMEHLRWVHRQGGMSDYEAYEHGIVDEAGAYTYDKFVTRLNDGTKECKYCGEKGLVWKEFTGKFRLVDEEGSIHSCDKYIGEPQC